MRTQSNGTSASPVPLQNAFSPAFLDSLQEHDEALTAAEAELSGPWKCVPVLGRPGVVAVLREWEDLERGDLPEGIFCQEETALLFSIVLPLLGREPRFHLDDQETAEGFAVSAV
jgi:hypothetical protein